MDKLGYLFDPITKILVGTVGVQESPLEPGYYLLPPNCTLKPPLSEVAGKTCAFVQDTWVYVDDPLPLPQTPAPIETIRQTMVVSRYQGKAALVNAGLYDQVVAYFTNPSTPLLTRLAWEDVLVFERLSPLVISMGQMLNLTDDSLDQLFTQAALITV